MHFVKTLFSNTPSNVCACWSCKIKLHCYCKLSILDRVPCTLFTCRHMMPHNMSHNCATGKREPATNYFKGGGACVSSRISGGQRQLSGRTLARRKRESPQKHTTALTALTKQSQQMRGSNAQKRGSNAQMRRSKFQKHGSYTPKHASQMRGSSMRGSNALKRGSNVYNRRSKFHKHGWRERGSNFSKQHLVAGARHNLAFHGGRTPRRSRYPSFSRSPQSSPERSPVKRKPKQGSKKRWRKDRARGRGGKRRRGEPEEDEGPGWWETARNHSGKLLAAAAGIGAAAYLYNNKNDIANHLGNLRHAGSNAFTYLKNWYGAQADEAANLRKKSAKPLVVVDGGTDGGTGGTVGTGGTGGTDAGGTGGGDAEEEEE